MALDRGWRRLASAVLVGVTLAAGAPAHAKSPYTAEELRAVETSEEAKIRELRDQEITQLRIALGRRAAQNRRADLYFRLAEIYVEAYRAAFLLEGRAHDRRLASGRGDQYMDRSHSMPFLHNGIKACNEILSYRIPYQKLDEVYYFLGFSYGELGDRKRSVANFQELARRFPGSPFAGEAYRELGDAAFGAAQFKNAQAYYEAAARKAAPEALPRIQHKLAWSYYRTRQFTRAVQTMKDAVASASRSGEKYLSLREEALRDMAIFMTETGQTEEAISYFQGVADDKGFYPRLLEKLGKQYERNVEPVKAIQVYESLLKTNPESEAAFRVLVKLVDLYLRQGKFSSALAKLKGAKLLDGGEHETQVAAQNLKAMIRRTATEHHEKYRKQSNRAALEIAEAFYQSYLSTFLAQSDPRKETPEIQMYLAEVKRDLGKSKEASELYRQVVGTKDSRYAKEAGALWTASLADAIKKTAAASGANAGSSQGDSRGAVKPGEPSAMEKEFVDAADRLQEALGDTSEAREAALRAAQVSAGYRETQKEAVSRIRKILARWEKSPQALIAARLWVQLLSDSADAQDELAETLQDLRKRPGLMQADQEQGGKLKSLLAEQELRLKIGTIARQEKDRNFQAAAKGYEALAQESNTREFSEKAFENAMANYAKLADLESVERVSGLWLKRFPKSGKALDAARAAATQWLIQGRFEPATRLFERVGREGGDADALETAARLHEGLGDSTRAQQVWTAYLELFPKATGRSYAALSLGKIQDDARRDSEAAKAYQLCMSGGGELEAICGARLGDLFLRNKDVEQARAQFRRVAGSADKKKDAISPAVAYARFRLADLQEQAAKFEALQLPEAQLKRAMTQRLEFLEPLSRSYTSAVESGGPWGVAALGRLATWAMKFANDIDGIPAPSTASAEAVHRFRKSLESVSTPLRKRAISAWNEGYQKAVAAEILSPALPEIADRLADARSTAPMRAQGARGKLRIAGLAPDGGSDGKNSAFQAVRERLGRNPKDAGAWVDYGNLLWGDGKPGIAKMAYDRALALDAKSAAALNNRAVVELQNGGEEDWLLAARAYHGFAEAQRHDAFFLPAKFNRALLLNYYRLFVKAKPLWEQVLVKDGSGEALDGSAVALQGLGELAKAEAAFKKAGEAGLPAARFTRVYHEAARESLRGAEGAARCLSLLEELDPAQLGGFEKSSATNLKETCTLWKDVK